MPSLYQVLTRLRDLTDVVLSGTGWLHWDGSGATISTPTAADVGAAPLEVAARWSLAAGYWYAGANPSFTTGALAAGVLVASPLVVPRACTVDQLACEVTSPGSAGAVLRLGIYATGANGLPGALVADAGTVAATSAAVLTVTGLTIALAPGLYWLAAVTQGAPVTPPTTRINANPTLGIGLQAASQISSFNAAYQLGTGVTGALPAAAPGAAPTTSCHRVLIHLSS